MAADMAVMLAQKRQASLALAEALMQQAPLQAKNLMAHRFVSRAFMHKRWPLRKRSAGEARPQLETRRQSLSSQDCRA